MNDTIRYGFLSLAGSAMSLVVVTIGCCAALAILGIVVMLSPAIVSTRIIQGIIYNYWVSKSLHYHPILGLLDPLLIAWYLAWLVDTRNRVQVSWKVYIYAMMMLAINYYLRWYSVEYHDNYNIFLKDIQSCLAL
jgi:hypothetical protein